MSDIEQSIKRKIEAIGVPLRNWDVRINYGVKTGCNEAFIIDGATKDRLLADDPKSAEIIRPILRGRDIKRYQFTFANRWIIATFPSKKYDIEDYPSVKQYLLSHGIRRLEQSGKKDIEGVRGLNARKKTHNKWFETQDAIAYWDDFSKPKIIYPDIMRIPRTAQGILDYPKFVFDTEGYFVEATNFMIVGAGVEAIYAFLSSDIGFYLFSNFYTGPQFDSTGFRYKKAYLQNLPIPIIDKHNLNRLKQCLIELSAGKNRGRNQAEIEDVFANALLLSKTERKEIQDYKLRLIEVDNSR